jgi:hypothetical protein
MKFWGLSQQESVRHRTWVRDENKKHPPQRHRDLVIAVTHKIQKGLMNAGVVAQFWMERRGHNVALTNSYGVVSLPGNYLNPLP